MLERAYAVILLNPMWVPSGLGMGPWIIMDEFELGHSTNLPLTSACKPCLEVILPILARYTHGDPFD